MKPPARLAPLVLAASVLGGVAIALVTPPFQAPDEPLHIFRVWQIVDGGWLSHGAWAPVPLSLSTAAGTWTGALAGRQQERASLADVAALGRTPLAAATTEEVWLSSPAAYPPVPYLPQAAGLRLGLLLAPTALGVLWAIRLANALVTAGLVALAVHVAPASHRPLFALLAMTPMALFLRATASPDATIASAALLAAAVLARETSEPHRARGGLFAVAAGGLAFSKLPYAPLPLLDFVVPKGDPRSRGRRRLALSATIAIAALATLLALARANLTRLRPDTDPARQLAGALADPLGAAAVILRTVVLEGPRWASQVAGNFGWLDAAPPVWLQGAWLVALTVAFLATPALGLDGRRRLLVALFLVGLGVSIVLSQYLTWTHLGDRRVEGVQGRYFLPLLAFATLLTPGLFGRRISAAALERLAVAAGALAPAIVVATQIARYWL